ncbi:uncharacterized protein LOC116343931 [Contarinia nasturtii]|uniref:uncharacterized protein LOC116343931 n=1 Tax=Contarinia nasturtii TaxID=265458 RepID=UPI0012D3745B|nr:uncharacterized protein LOC116343931 [Contarinia nasturtii]
MLRKVVIFMVVFIVGMIASEESFFADYKDANNFDTEIYGDLLIKSAANTNDEIAHKPEHSHMLESKSYGKLVHYSIGARVSSDRLVASGGQNQSWPSPHNVQIQLTYPSEGFGAQVTYVAIVVNQTSTLGQAYIVKGGINEHMISIIVDAYSTSVFNVFAYIYGI